MEKENVWNREGLIALPPERMVPIIRESLECCGKFVLTVTGNSMVPTLHHLDDKVELVSPTDRSIRRGEIVLFQRASGECILHRVVRMDGDHLILNGDAQNWVETVSMGQVLGVVSRISRNGQWHSCDASIYRCFVTLWRTTRPIRPFLFRLKRSFAKDHR